MNNQTLTITGLVLALAVAPLSASAGEGFYVGASIGSANLDDDFDGFEIDDDATAYRLNAGWQVNQYVGLEFGYQNFGDFEQSFDINGERANAKLSADGYTLGVTASYPLGEHFELLGRAGAFFWDGEAEINNASQADPGDTNPYFGAGLGYNFNQVFSVYADWIRYDLEDTESDVLSLGFRFRFGR